MTVLYYVHGFFLFFWWSFLGLLELGHANGMTAVNKETWLDEIEPDEIEKSIQEILYQDFE